MELKSSRARQIFVLSVASLPLLFASTSMNQIVTAQNSPSSYSPKPYKLLPEESHKMSQLRDKVDLPDFPAYTGKSKFVMGTVEQEAKGGPRYSMVFDAEEPPSQVIDWYDNVFRMYKWTNIRTAVSSVSANHKDGHYASVSTNAVVKPGDAKNKLARCSFTVHYQMAVR